MSRQGHIPVKMFVHVGLAALLATVLIGCTAIKRGPVEKVQAVSTPENPRVGNVYLLRGFIGIFSTGVDQLTEQINAGGVRALVFQDEQYRELGDHLVASYKYSRIREPLVLVGHSYGADDVVRIARRLDDAGVTVDLLITLDPVTPPAVPKNVVRCVNLYQSNGMWDSLPWLRGIPLKSAEGAKTQLVNFNIRTDRTDLLEPGLDHFNIEKQPKIHNEIVKQVLATCVPRANWANRATTKPAQTVVKASTVLATPNASVAAPTK